MPVDPLFMSIEQPAYETLKKDGDFEIRRYNGYILAGVDEKGDMDTALNKGFRALFDYITGHNRVRQKIPMTAPVTEEMAEGPENIPMTVPVTMEMAGEDVYTVAFIMPGKYTLDTLPQPDNKDIRFREVPDHNVAVLRFSGHSHEPKVREMSDKLKEWLLAHDMVPKSNFRLARYDPPWVPGFMRHNEVMADV
jgi:SOUL heme-binding protein